MQLHPLDWTLIALYLLFALLVGFWVRERANRGAESYFVASRSLPWWWAGISIAATTFAADTPLAVTGIVADRGLSGNWMWLSWIGVHAVVVVYFAARWRRSGVITDAELIGLRYSGRPAEWLRGFRVVLFGVVYNAIILGWVLRAMGKIAHPIFRWDEWIPGVTHAIGVIWPANTTLGSPSEGLTIVVLVAVVTLYSALGGIRGVILTDLVQFAIALVGSFWLAGAAWSAVGGGAGLIAGLDTLYGTDHGFLNLFPSLNGGWVGALGIGAFGFGSYLIVQSYANVPADGGGYLMQRLASCRSERDASKAAALFTALHYCVRVWPWFIVAAAALVLIPIGQESTALNGAGLLAAGDREMTYPILLFELLPVGARGLLVASLLAAFMSTVDTHFNWGASYIVNDLYLRVRPNASPESQVRVARMCVASFAVLSVIVALRIDTIEQAWTWVAFLGAALGIPTALRWLWWRVNATAELAAAAVGLLAALVMLMGTSWPYELRLAVTSGASALGMLVGIWLGPATRQERVASFEQRVKPIGVWPGSNWRDARAGVARVVRAAAAVIVGVVGVLAVGTWLLFGR